MNQEIKAQWLADLRSGEYKQAYGYLTIYGRYCCLGVLCEQAVKAGVTVKTMGGYGSFGERMVLSSEVLPLEVMKWAELTTQDPVVRYGDSLTYLNDRAGLSFEQIADVIEESEL